MDANGTRSKSIARLLKKLGVQASFGKKLGQVLYASFFTVPCIHYFVCLILNVSMAATLPG